MKIVPLLWLIPIALLSACSGEEEVDEGSAIEIPQVTDQPTPIYAFTDGLSLGLMTADGTVVMAPQFSELGPWNDGRMWYREINRYGYLNGMGEVAIPAEFDKCFSFMDGIAQVWVGDKAGYIDTTGAWIIEPKFDRGSGSFSQGRAHVLQGGKFGIINTSGEWVVEPRYNEFASRSFAESPQLSSGVAYNEGYAVARLGGDYFVMDTSGDVIHQSKGKAIGYVSEGLQISIAAMKIGFAKPDGTEVIAPIYMDGRPFSEGLAPVKAGKAWVYIDSAENRKFDRKTWASAYPFRDGLAKVECNEGRWGWINIRGEPAIACTWVWAEDFQGALARVSDSPSGNPWYHINRRGERVLPKTDTPIL